MNNPPFMRQKYVCKEGDFFMEENKNNCKCNKSKKKCRDNGSKNEQSKNDEK